jgi:3D (Asp-Asp-Asp) domain-containing protein
MNAGGGLTAGGRPRVCGGSRGCGQAGLRRPARSRVAPTRALVLLCVIGGLCGCYSAKTAGMRRQVVPMEVTAYCACKECCDWKRKWGCCLLPRVYASGPNKGKRKKVGITADGSKAEKGTIAADTRLYPFGTVMRVPGYGWGVVHDRGRAIRGKHIDVFFKSHEDALRWGRQHLKVEVYSCDEGSVADEERRVPR